MALQEELRKQGDYLFRHRSYLPLVLLLLGILYKIYIEFFLMDPDVSLLSIILESCAIFVGLTGVLIRALTVGYTPRNTSGRNTKQGQVADFLNTNGIYSIIRNPLYVGNYFMWLSIAMLTGNIWFIAVFSLVFWIYYERIVYAEEYFLRQKFGKRYLEWASDVPPFLPRHFKFRKAGVPFNWKKVLRKEKNGLLALFLVFLLFDFMEILALGKPYLINKIWPLAGSCASILIYIVVRILTRYTKVLRD